MSYFQLKALERRLDRQEKERVEALREFQVEFLPLPYTEDERDDNRAAVTEARRRRGA